MGRVLATTLAAGLALSLGSSALAAGDKLKQYRVPTEGSSPRQITEGIDGNLWFTESFINNPNASPHNVARITPAGDVTEFVVCDFCFPGDIVQGGDGLLYFSSNDGLGRISTDGVVEPLATPFQVGDAVAAHGDDVWVTDFNSDSLWRFDTTSDGFTQFPVGPLQPTDVAVDTAGTVWFGASDLGAAGEQGVIARLEPDIVDDPGTPERENLTTVDVGAVPRAVTIATDGKVWFTARFTPQAVGYFDPATATSTVFPADGGPQDLAPAPDGTIWFTRTTAGDIARINDAGTIITQSKTIKGSEPFGITVATSGDPWFAMLSADKIGTLELVP
jgi:streptogramin lyase